LSKIMLSGGCAKVSGLAAQLSERMGLPVELANSFQNIDVSAAGLDEDSLLALAPIAAVGVGLAMRTSGDR
jgi:type IV pilus assembly protein PilM